MEKLIKVGKKAAVAAQDLRADYDAARKKIEVEIEPVLDNITTCRVAARLKEANKKGGSE